MNENQFEIKPCAGSNELKLNNELRAFWFKDAAVMIEANGEPSFEMSLADAKKLSSWILANLEQ